MTTIQAIIMGLIQGLTEYLPVSSSGHLAMTFTIAVHVATVLSTIVVLGRQIGQIIVGTFSPLGPGTGLQRLNPSQQYLLNIVISMVPIGIVGVFFKDQVEAIFGSGLTIVGICLLVTALLLTFSYLARPRQRQSISPALAVLPGLSRSGTTIATGLMLGNNKATMAQFSFLMVIPPILGEALLDVIKMTKGESIGGDIAMLPLIAGFIAAFISGCAACKWMIALVSRGKLIYFAYYCAIAGAATLIYSLVG